MFRKTISSLMLVLLVASILLLSLKISPVNGAEATIYIDANGSITPSAAPISTVDNITYTLTGDIINGSIVIERSNIVVNGNGYTVQGDQSGIGLSLSGINNVTIENINVKSFSFGIYLSDSNGNIISENKATANYQGIFLVSSSDNIISGNNASANSYDGIRLYSSSDNNMISGNNASANYEGIFLNSSSNNIISGNNVTSDYNGVNLESSSDSTVSGNNIVNNRFGLTLTHSTDITVSQNNVTANYIALGLYSSNENNVFGNNVTNNDRGVFIQSSLDNTFYQNNFGNFVQVVETGSEGAWDHGYPSGGNYWKDYTGVDLKSGPNQDQNWSDGIGDIPYVIDNNNMDHYPLTMPWASYSHDVAVNSIKSAKTIIGEGFDSNVMVAVANFGDNAETFNVTAYANSTVLGTQLVVNLGAASSVVLTFSFNTTSLSTGNYTLSAYAWPVPGETYAANNNVTGGVVLVTIPGDLNGDFRVSVQDLVILALAYGTKPGDQKWNPNADITGDNNVGAADLAILVQHYGQPHPP